MKATKFLELLEKRKYNFFTGVPCSYFTSLCSVLALRGGTFHVPAVREDIAVGIACGAYLAGKRPAIYMQNSGLGYSLEAFAALPLIYQMPLLVLVSYRGPQDPGMEEHLVMGQHTEEILKSFAIDYSIFDGTGNPNLPQVGQSPTKAAPGSSPINVLLIKKGALT